jgi:hypothetical protein
MDRGTANEKTGCGSELVKRQPKHTRNNRKTKIPRQPTRRMGNENKIRTTTTTTHNNDNNDNHYEARKLTKPEFKF